MNDNYNEDDFLQPEIMIQLYTQGAFPMADETGRIDWFFPETRAIIPIKNFNVPRSLQKFLTTCNFSYKFDCDTIAIIKECANRKETWINEKLIEAYKKLLLAGFVHSVGVYQDNQLVGGLYGISFNGLFFGESMYSKVEQASKAALVRLLEHLKSNKFALLDIQYITDHLKMFGAVEIPLPKYKRLLKKGMIGNAKF